MYFNFTMKSQKTISYSFMNNKYFIYILYIFCRGSYVAGRSPAPSKDVLHRLVIYKEYDTIL